MNSSARQPSDMVDLTWAALWRTGYLTRVFLLSIGVCLHAANVTLTTTLLPSAVREIGGVELLSWSLILYLVGSITAGAVGGFLAARYSLRSAMLGAVGLFAFGCLISAAAPIMTVLLIGRLLQGLGGGAVVSLTFVSIVQIFPAAMTPRLFAVMSAIWGAAALCGPFIGGVSSEFASWRIGFASFAIVGAMYFVIAMRVIPRSRPDIETAPVPIKRLMWLAAGISAAALAAPFGLAWPAAAFAALSAFLLWRFLARDRTARENGLFPRRLYRRKSASRLGVVAVILLGGGPVAISVYGPILAQAIYGVGPLASGLLVASEAVAWSVAAVVTSGADVEKQARHIKRAGLLITASVFGVALGLYMGPIWICLIFLLILGYGYGSSFGFIVQRVVSDAEISDRGRASSAVPTGQNIGYALGAAASGLIANAIAFTETSSPALAQQVALVMIGAATPVCALGWFLSHRVASAPVVDYSNLGKDTSL